MMKIIGSNVICDTRCGSRSTRDSGHGLLIIVKEGTKGSLWLYLRLSPRLSHSSSKT
jgi:hypothetical protein